MGIFAKKTFNLTDLKIKMVEEVYNYGDLTKKLICAKENLVVLYLYDSPYFINYPSYKEFTATSMTTENVVFLRANATNCSQMASLNNCHTYPVFIYLKDRKVFNSSTHTRNPLLLSALVRKYGKIRTANKIYLKNNLSTWETFINQPKDLEKRTDGPLIKNKSQNIVQAQEHIDLHDLKYSDFVRQLLYGSVRQG